MQGLREQNARLECDDSETSGTRTRQLCGFFVPGIRVMAGRATDTTARKGKEVHRLVSVINLPATSRVRVMTAPRVFKLDKEQAMTTTALVPVFSGTLAGQPTQLCNARDLHGFLAVGRDFSTWFRDRVTEYGFEAEQDYAEFSPDSGKTGGRRRKDYHLTLDMAKELAMIENNDQGRAVRRYFIQCERSAQQAAAGQLAAQPALPATRAEKKRIRSREDLSFTQRGGHLAFVPDQLPDLSLDGENGDQVH